MRQHLLVLFAAIVFFALLGPLFPLPTASVLQGKGVEVFKTFQAYPLALLFGFAPALFTAICYCILLFFASAFLRWRSRSLKLGAKLVFGATLGFVVSCQLVLPPLWRHTLRFMSNVPDLHDQLFASLRVAFFSDGINLIALFTVPAVICGAMFAPWAFSRLDSNLSVIATKKSN